MLEERIKASPKIKPEARSLPSENENLDTEKRPNKCRSCGYIGNDFKSKGFNRKKRQWGCPSCGAKSTQHLFVEKVEDKASWEQKADNFLDGVQWGEQSN